MFIFCFNGPPRSGKDTAAEIVRQIFGKSCRQYKFASALKLGVHASFGLNLPEDAFEKVKDEPRKEFLGVSPRNAYIRHSENYMKLFYGDRIFGDILAKRITREFIADNRLQFATISDCGFVVEMTCLLDAFDPRDVVVCRMFREGCDFTNDSRSYLPDDLVKSSNLYDIYNNGTILNLRETIEKIILRHT